MTDSHVCGRMNKEYKIVTNCTDALLNKWASQGWRVQQLTIVPFNEQNPLNPREQTLKLTFHVLMEREAEAPQEVLDRLTAD